jgi:hypothetical protein
VSDWHTYAVEWEPGELRLFVDEVQTCTCRHWWSCSRLEGGQGVEAGSEAELNTWPAELVVDWVRVYDKVGEYGEVAPRGPGVMPWEPGNVAERRL